MKKQLIIAAIACAVSGAAFAATEGSHAINLQVNPQNSLEFIASEPGILGGETNWDFDDVRHRDRDYFSASIGTFSLVGTGFTTETTCTLNIDSVNGDWELRTPNTEPGQGVQYGVKDAGGSIAYGNYFGSTPFTADINSTTHTCNDTSPELYVVTESLDGRHLPEVGTYTDTIRFTVSPS